MEAVQLFLNVSKSGIVNNWNEQINAVLQSLIGVERVEVIGQNQSSNARIDIVYDVNKLPFQKIEETVKDLGVTITDINIHFSTDVSGVTSPYGASALATAGEDDLKSIEGVIEIGVSSTGILKARIDTQIENKQTVIENIIRRTRSYMNPKA